MTSAWLKTDKNNFNNNTAVGAMARRNQKEYTYIYVQTSAFQKIPI